MIPKKIHYVWLGGKKLSYDAQDFIEGWKKKMPDYEIKCWNEKSFDCNSVPWVKQAIDNKMWAFAADYIRLFALYTEGGIYMDTDVEVLRPFDDFLNYDFFSATEIHSDFQALGLPKLDTDFRPKTKGEAIPCFGILSAIMGASKGNALIKESIDYYKNRNFVDPSGSMFVKIIIPDVLGIIAVNYGFRYIDETQQLEGNMVIFNSHVLVGSIKNLKEDSYAVHYCEGSWRRKWWPRRKKIADLIITSIRHLFGYHRKYNEESSPVSFKNF
jgi:hypothetical protein